MTGVNINQYDDQLLSLIHPSRSQEWMPEVEPTLVRQLIQSPRLKLKLTCLVWNHYRLAPLTGTISQNDYRLAMLAEQNTDRLIKAAGIVWNGQVLQHAIARSNLSEIVSFIDEKTYRVALDYITLSPVSSSQAGPTPSCDNLWNDGVLCYLAWSQTLDRGLRERVILKFAPSVFPNDVPAMHEAHGPEIVRQVGQGLFSHV